MATNHQQHNQMLCHRRAVSQHTMPNHCMMTATRQYSTHSPRRSCNSYLKLVVHLGPKQTQLCCIQRTIVDAHVMYLAKERVQQTLRRSANEPWCVARRNHASGAAYKQSAQQLSGTCVSKQTQPQRTACLTAIIVSRDGLCARRVRDCSEVPPAAGSTG